MQQNSVIDLTDDQSNRQAVPNQNSYHYQDPENAGIDERSNLSAQNHPVNPNQHQFSIPLQRQLNPRNPADRYVTMFHDDYSRPRVLNTEQYLQLNGIYPNGGMASTVPSTSQPNPVGSQQTSQFQNGGPNIPKQRVLPATVTIPPGPVMTNSTASINPYYQNIQNRQQILTNTSQRPAGHLPYANTNSYYQPPLQSAPLLQKVPMVFSLINAEEFTARVETGSVPKELVQFLARIQGSTFDWKLKRFTFPILLHDQLQMTLQQKFNCVVEAIPRGVLAAAQLKSRSALQNQSTANGSSPEDLLEKEKKLNDYLGKVLPLYLLDSLATFQKEAVQFIIEKKGRALVGDEMGLGKTRTGIAAACVYHRDWPVLIVSPSSARHHWYAELNALVVNSHRPEFQHRKNKPPSNSNNAEQQSEITLEITDSPVTTPQKNISPVIIDMTSDNPLPPAPPPPPSSAPPLPPGLNLQPFPLIAPEDIVLIEKTNHFLQRPIDKHQSSKFFIISYSLITKLAASLQSIPFNVMIVDESHYIKSRQAKRTKSLVPMIQRCKRAILLSGTPALSRPLELFTQLNALLPKQWHDFKAFGKRYCQDATAKQLNSLSNSNSGNSGNSSSRSGGKGYSLFSNGHHRFKGFGDNAYKGANHTQELHVILTSTIMIRRAKKDILLQLPKKKRYLMKIEVEDVSKQQMLQQMLESLRKYEELLLKKNSNKGNNNHHHQKKIAMPSELTEGQELELQELKQMKKNILLKLFTISGEAKVPAMLKKLDLLFFHNQQFTGKILLFAHHHHVLSQVTRHLLQLGIPFIRIDGTTSSKERHQLTQSFQQDVSIRVGVLGITAAGIALTLTAANIVCFLELYWTPGSLIQAEDRVHRIGQLKNVKIFYFFGVNTIDELLWPLVRKKMQLLGEFVEGTTDQDLTAAVLNQSSTSNDAKATTTDDKSNAIKVSLPASSSFTSSSSYSQIPSQPPPAGTGSVGVEKGEEGVMDPVTRKMYSLETDEDILQLVEELNEEEIQTIGNYSANPRNPPSSSSQPTTATRNPHIPLIDLEQEEEEFKELVHETETPKPRKNKKKKSKKGGNKRAKKARNEGMEVSEEEDEEESDENNEEDDDEEEDEEDGEEGEDEYEEYLKRVDPPDILASVFMNLIEDEKRRQEMRRLDLERQQQYQQQLQFQRQHYSFGGYPVGAVVNPSGSTLTSSFTVPATSTTNNTVTSGQTFTIPRFVNTRPRTPEIIDLIQEDHNHHRSPNPQPIAVNTNDVEQKANNETSDFPSLIPQGFDPRPKVTASSLEVNDHMFDDVDLQILETISASPVSYPPVPPDHNNNNQSQTESQSHQVNRSPSNTTAITTTANSDNNNNDNKNSHS